MIISRVARPHHRTVAAVALALVAVSLAPGAHAAPVAAADDPPVGEAVSLELATVFGPGGKADDSTATHCMEGPSPEPLAYSARQVVLRAELTPKQAKAAVRAAIAEAQSPGRVVSARRVPLPPVPGPVPGVGAELVPLLVVEVAPRPGSEAEVEVVGVSRSLRAHDIDASPNYLLSPSDGSLGVWPDGYPEPTALTTQPRQGRGGGAVVWVFDTGLAPAAQSERPPNVEELVLGTDDEVLDAEPRKGVVDRYYGGHTVAIADVFATIAPDAEVFAVRITGPNGIATDVSAAARMARTLRHPGPDPDVIVNSFGSPACDVSADPDDGEMVPLGLAAIAEVVEGRDRSVVVAAAGNRSTDRAFYPGGFDTQTVPSLDAVIGVGAIEPVVGGSPAEDVWTSSSRTAPVADFSNFGTAVDAWAPGVDLPVRHVLGLRFVRGDPKIAGRATVDGTSFAAPYVGALVAEVISSAGLSAPEAWKSLLASGTTCSVGGTALALVSLSSSATTRSDEPPAC